MRIQQGLATALFAVTLGQSALAETSFVIVDGPQASRGVVVNATDNEDGTWTVAVADPLNGENGAMGIITAGSGDGSKIKGLPVFEGVFGEDKKGNEKPLKVHVACSDAGLPCWLMNASQGLHSVARTFGHWKSTGGKPPGQEMHDTLVNEVIPNLTSLISAIESATAAGTLKKGALGKRADRALSTVQKLKSELSILGTIKGTSQLLKAEAKASKRLGRALRELGRVTFWLGKAGGYQGS